MAQWDALAVRLAFPFLLDGGVGNQAKAERLPGMPGQGDLFDDGICQAAKRVSRQQVISVVQEGSIRGDLGLHQEHDGPGEDTDY